MTKPTQGATTKRHRRVTRRLTVAVAVVVGMVMALTQPAAAGVGNPGPVEMEVLEDSGFALNDAGGNLITGYLVGLSACEDGADNDADGDIDFPADTECASAEDENERLAGEQSLTPFPPTIDVDVDAAGNITLGAGDIHFPQVEGCADPGFGVSCLAATLVAAGPMTGFIDPGAGTIEMDASLSVEMEATFGAPGFNDDCVIGPIEGTLLGEYDQTTGIAGFGVEGLEVPEIPGTVDCGEVPLIGFDYRDDLLNPLLVDATADVLFLAQLDPIVVSD